MDRPTVLYILCSMVSAQQTNLCLKMFPEMIPFSPKVRIKKSISKAVAIIKTTSQLDNV